MTARAALKEYEARQPVEDVIARARELLDRVTFDDRGRIVAGKQVGGNGGLLSRETIIAAEQLRRALNDHDNTQRHPDDDVQAIAARAIIRAAAKPPGMRGPWIFDEDELQAKARLARAYLKARAADR